MPCNAQSQCRQASQLCPNQRTRLHDSSESMLGATLSDGRVFMACESCTGVKHLNNCDSRQAHVPIPTVDWRLNSSSLHALHSMCSAPAIGNDDLIKVWAVRRWRRRCRRWGTHVHMLEHSSSARCPHAPCPCKHYQLLRGGFSTNGAEALDDERGLAEPAGALRALCGRRRSHQFACSSFLVQQTRGPKWVVSASPPQP